MTEPTVRVCASFNVRKSALPDFCQAASRIATEAGLDEHCGAFRVQREIGWTRQVSTEAQSLFMLVQEWQSGDALEEHVRSPAAMRFDRDLKEGDILACAPMLSLFGPELLVADLKAMAAEARASGLELPNSEVKTADPVPETKSQGYIKSPGAGKGSPQATGPGSKGARAARASAGGSTKNGAWK
ncbi:unnamed protein product [Durusdinium trenchii]|uniref:ABM domain-containing protein n=2 Tax=Durusdinium trenchii TaxID=1381693 RepID=A0ABP0J462_9DINO